MTALDSGAQAASGAGASAGFDALILAGGRGRRLGGIDKASVELSGRRLVDRAVDAARNAGAERIIVAGPTHTGSPGVTVMREDPPFAGPLAALAAAMPEVQAERLLLLACDLVRPDLTCAELLRAGEDAGEAYAIDREGRDGVLLRDATGRSQWLAGIYRVEALRSGLAAMEGEVENAPLRLLFDALDLRLVRASDEATGDIDEPDDLARARSHEQRSTP